MSSASIKKNSISKSIEKSIKSINSIKSKSAENIISKTDQDADESIKEIPSIANSKESINQNYIDATANIEKHNRCINELKRQIQEKSKIPKTIRTCIDEKELNLLECCLQKEIICLNKLKQCTIEMQATNSNNKPWGVIPLSTTMEEDEMPRIMLFSSGSFNQPSKISMQSKDLPAACIQKNLIAQNINLETNRNQLKNDLSNRNKIIESLTQKLQCLQCKMVQMAKRTAPTNKIPCASEKHQDHLDQMSMALHQIQQELNAIHTINTNDKNYHSHSEDENCFHYSELSPPPVPDSSLTSETHMLCDDKKQNRELSYLREKIDDLCACQSTGQKDSPEQIQLNICKRRIRDLLEEQEDFKSLIVEQQKQMNDYRDKYLQAQQKVIEQKCQMDGMEVNNKRIEEQINSEMHRIKKRFQDKLQELAPLPKLLENEQFRLIEMTKRNDELESKISIVCKELRQTKKELNALNGKGNALELESKCTSLCSELCELKKKFEQSVCEKHCIETQLKHVQDELNTSQNQSNRLITRTKERCENTKDNMKMRIDQLEMDLAQCRADAAICLADRESVIRQMKSQLSDLSGSFDGAQRQIRNLKNRMNILSEPSKELNVSEINCNC